MCDHVVEVVQAEDSNEPANHEVLEQALEWHLSGLAFGLKWWYSADNTDCLLIEAF